MQKTGVLSVCHAKSKSVSPFLSYSKNDFFKPEKCRKNYAFLPTKFNDMCRMGRRKTFCRVHIGVMWIHLLFTKMPENQFLQFLTQCHWSQNYFNIYYVWS